MFGTLSGGWRLFLIWQEECDRRNTHDVYAALRQAALAHIDVRELQGRRLPEVGCGSGHKTAGTWPWLKRNAEFIAVAAEPGWLTLAQNAL